MKKVIIYILACFPLFSIAQNKFLDEANGYKIFKLGAVLDKSKVAIGSKQDNGSTTWLIKDSSLLLIGDINVNSAAVTTYNDTIRSIILVLSSSDGSKLASAYYEKFGFPKEKNSNVYEGYEWKTENVSLNISSKITEYIAYYYDVKFMNELNKKEKEKAANDL